MSLQTDTVRAPWNALGPLDRNLVACGGVELTREASPPVSFTEAPQVTQTPSMQPVGDARASKQRPWYPSRLGAPSLTCTEPAEPAWPPGGAAPRPLAQPAAPGSASPARPSGPGAHGWLPSGPLPPELLSELETSCCSCCNRREQGPLSGPHGRWAGRSQETSVRLHQVTYR